MTYPPKTPSSCTSPPPVTYATSQVCFLATIFQGSERQQPRRLSQSVFLRGGWGSDGGDQVVMECSI